MPDDQGHQGGIRAATLMKERVCTGGLDGRLMIWRGERCDSGGGPGRLALALDNEVGLSQTGAVTAVLFHEASGWLFCGLSEGLVCAFRQAPQANVTLTGHGGAVTALCMHEAVLVSAALDGTVRAWQYDQAVGSFHCAATVQSPLGNVFALHTTAGALGGVGGLLWLGTQQGISCLKQGLQPVGEIRSTARVVGFLPYQGCVIAAFTDGRVKVFDALGNEQFSHGPLGEHTTNTAVALIRHPQSNKDVLLCGQELGKVTAYDVPDFRPRGTFTTGFEGEVTVILDMGEDGIFLTCDLSGEMVLWRWDRDGSTQM